MGRINQTLLPVKLYNLFFYGSVVCVMPIIPTYMRTLGVSDVQLSVIYGVMPFVGFFSRPITGYLTDKYQVYKVMVIISTMIYGLANVLHLAVPPVKGVSPLPCGLKVICPVTDACILKEQSRFQTCHLQPTHDLNETALLSCNEASLSAFPRMCHFRTALNTTLRPVTYSMELNSIQLKRAYECDDIDVSTLPECAEDVTELHCQLDCSNKTVKECREELGTRSSTDVFFSTTFILFFILQLVSNLAVSTVMPLADAIALELVEKDQEKFCRQRVWGSIGFGSIALVAGAIGFALYYFKSCPVKHFTEFYFYFYIYLVLITVCAFVSFFFNNKASKPPELIVRKVVGVIVRNVDVIVFFVVIFVIGMLSGVTEAFAVLYFVLKLNATPLSLGITLSLMFLLAETPVMFLAGSIMKKIPQTGCLCISLFAWALRFFLYTVANNYWYQVPIELLHGLTFGLMFPAASTYVSTVSPEGTTATMQSLLQSILFGVSKGIGTLAGGAVLKAKNNDLVFLFRSCSVLALVTGVMYTIYALVHRVDPTSIADSIPNDEDEMRNPDSAPTGDEALPSAEEDSVFISGSEKA